MARAVRKREVRIYEDAQGNRPYLEGLYMVRDQKTRNRIVRRIDRMQHGNFGDHRGVGGGIFEMRLFFGSGYRVYFGQDGAFIVLLLCGGDKSTQKEDIERAKRYWKDYKERTP